MTSAMTSDKKRLANRANASKSTGPRTSAGKSRASRNALRHGLSTMALALDGYGDRIAQIANKLCENDPFPYRYEIALEIAEAQVFLDRIRFARAVTIENETKAPARKKSLADVLGFGLTDSLQRALVEYKIRQVVRIIRSQTKTFKSLMEALLRGDMLSLQKPAVTPPRTPTREEQKLQSFCAALDELAILERYEQRAISKKKRAIRKFLVLQD
jgi:hypothetical protein